MVRMDRAFCEDSARRTFAASPLRPPHRLMPIGAMPAKIPAAVAAPQVVLRGVDQVALRREVAVAVDQLEPFHARLLFRRVVEFGGFWNGDHPAKMRSGASGTLFPQ